MFSRKLSKDGFLFDLSGKGFSLLEILIAFAILSSFAVALIQVFRQGGARQENFSSEHFTAMFLAQKVLEDINDRVVENPHFFTELLRAGIGERKSVVYGKSPYFKLLENTQNFQFLDSADDHSILPESGKIFGQMKNFECQIESKFVPDPDTLGPVPNLIEVFVNIFWIDNKGNPKSYSLSQYVSGFNQDEYFSPKIGNEFGAFSDLELGTALWEVLDPANIPADPTFVSFINANGPADEKVVRAFGDIFCSTQSAEEISPVLDEKIKQLIQKRDICLTSADPLAKSQATIYQKKIGFQLEQKAAVLYSHLVGISKDVTTLEQSSLGPQMLGNKLSADPEVLMGYLAAIKLLTYKMEIAFSAAKSAYNSLLNAPYHENLDKRMVTQIHRKVLDLAKLAIFFYKDSSMKQIQELGNLRARINALKNMFRGKQPFFLDFLNKEDEIVTSYQTIKEFYGGQAGFAGQIEGVLVMRNKLETLSSRLN